MKKIRAAIIGQGRSGYSIHATHMTTLKDMFEIVAAVDPIKKRRDRAAAEFHCDVYRDHQPVCKRKDLDLVVNATPSHLRVPVGLNLHRAGHNVLHEKPLAKAAKDVDRLIAAAKKKGKVLAIFQQSRFAPFFEQIKKVLDSGVLGRIVQFSIAYNGFSRRWDWQTLTEFDGGNLLNTGPHPLDQALRLMDVPLGEKPEIFCHMDNAHFWGDAEAHVSLSMRYPGKPFVNLEISSCCAYPCFTYQIYGTQGGLKASQQEMLWRYYDPKKSPKHRATKKPIETEEGKPAYCREQLEYTEEKWTVPPASSDLFHSAGTKFYKMLYDHMVEGKPLVITPEQVRQQIAVIEECHKQNPHIWGKKGAAKKAAKKK